MHVYCKNVFAHLPQGSHFLYHQFDVLMVLLLCVVFIIILPVTAAWQVGLDEYGLSPSYVTATVWARAASWLLLDSYQWQVTGRVMETLHECEDPLSCNFMSFELCIVEHAVHAFKEQSHQFFERWRRWKIPCSTDTVGCGFPQMLTRWS